ncbi:MAG TPA: recombinase RecT [Phycisphaerales bacterium]|nr:recombinase RecT [Phycisphaerales bacterium]
MATKEVVKSEAVQTADGNEIVERREPAGGGIRGLLEAKRQAMAAVATAHLTPEKLIKIVGVAMSRTPDLMRCTPMSVLNAVMTLAELGLAPNTLGSAYLIPFRNGRTGTYECQLIVGYRGLVELARRSGTISTIHAEVVRDGDEWELEFGLDAKLRHVPRAAQDAKIRLAYAIARFKDGSHQIAVMTKDEIDAIRKRSKAAGSGPWVSDYAEMAKKTVLRRLCKLLPLTPELEHQVAIADRTEFDFGDLAGSEPTPGAAGLADRMLGGKADDATPDEVSAAPATPIAGEVADAAERINELRAKAEKAGAEKPDETTFTDDEQKFLDGLD